MVKRIDAERDRHVQTALVLRIVEFGHVLSRSALGIGWPDTRMINNASRAVGVSFLKGDACAAMEASSASERSRYPLRSH